MDKKLDYKSKNELKKLLNVTDDPDVISSYLVTKTNEELSDEEFPHDDDDWAYWKTVYEHYEDETELSEQILDYIKAFLPWTDDEGMIRALQDEFELSETEARMYLDKTKWTDLDDESQVNPDDTVEVESLNEELKPTEAWQVQLPNGWTDVSKKCGEYWTNVLLRYNTNDSHYMLNIDSTLDGYQATLFDRSIIDTKFYADDNYEDFGHMLDNVVEDFTTIINSLDDTTQVESLVEAVNLDKVPAIDVTLEQLQGELSQFNKDTVDGKTTVVVQKMSQKKQLNIQHVRIRAVWPSNMYQYVDSLKSRKLLNAVIEHMKKVYNVDDTYFRYDNDQYFANADCNIKIVAQHLDHAANKKRITVDYWYRIQNDYNSFYTEWSRTVAFGQAIDQEGYPSIVNPKRMGLKGGQQVTFVSKEDAVNFADNMGFTHDYKISKSKANDYLYPIETIYGPAYMTDTYYKQLTDAGKQLPIGHVNNSTEVD